MRWVRWDSRCGGRGCRRGRGRAAGLVATERVVWLWEGWSRGGEVDCEWKLWLFGGRTEGILWIVWLSGL